ncbi:hypothetical protein [Kribbella deserti]|uniref:ABC transporter permease n=1 Tax=Kribbella deserti TaxID=1926257 RepID=A0ABV6QQM8_9ACTN
MPLRKLPTEEEAADALLQLEALRQRQQDRKAVWPPPVLMACAAGLLVTVLLPGSGENSCYLWRASSDPTMGRLVASLLPLITLAVVLLDAMLPERSTQRLRLRGWGAVVLGVLTIFAWGGLVTQGRTNCGSSPAIVGTVTLGLIATVTMIVWARHQEKPVPQLLPGGADAKAEAEPLNQAELRVAFVYLQQVLDRLKASHVLRLAPLAAGASGLLLLSTVLPWWELVDPVATGTAGSEAGLPRFQLWEMRFTGSWPVVLVATAVTTILAAVISATTPIARYARHAILLAGATATGLVTTTGLLVSVLRFPPRLADGVGYRAGVGAWLALALGLALTVLGLASLVQAVRRTSRGWPVQLASVFLAAVVGVTTSLATPTVTEQVSQPETRDGVPHSLLDLRGGLFSDPMGLRVSLGSHNALNSVAWDLDGGPGFWVMGRTGSDTSTVFDLRHGLALPRTSLSHGYSPPILIGVSGGRMLLLTAHARDRRWALLAVPLNLPFADLGLKHRNADGSYYVTPGVERLAQGEGFMRLQSSADSTVTMWNEDRTWRVPLAELRTGLRLDSFAIDLGPGSRSKLSSAPDGTMAWWNGRQGIAVMRPGRGIEQLTGRSAKGCPVSSDITGSDLGTAAFTVDTGGNIWVSGDARIPAAVLTPDGTLRIVPGLTQRVWEVVARPDGSVVLETRAGRETRLLVIPNAAKAAAHYKAAPPPSDRCRGPVQQASGKPYSGVEVPDVPEVVSPVAVDGKPGAPRYHSAHGLLALDPSGRLVRLQYPQESIVVAPDGEGGLWWGTAERTEAPNPRHFTAVHLPARARTAITVKDPVPAVARRREGSAAAYGDQFVAPMGQDRYGFYGPSGQAKQVPVSTNDAGSGKPVIGLTSSGAAGIVLQGRLVSVTPDGRQVDLFGGPGEEQWSIWSALKHRIPPDKWSAEGTWFGGPDGRLWGYDGSHLYRVDGVGKVTVIAGPEDGLPQVAYAVTRIGTDLYFEFGDDVLRVRTKVAR